MIDTRHLQKTLTNVVRYGNGFFEGIESEKLAFNNKLSAAIIPLLYSYIDMKASMNPDALHHVYEPGMVGSPQGRLFEFSSQVTKNIIEISATFIDSTASPLSGGDVFRKRASVMEAGATIIIEPKEGGILAFEDDGELVVTSAAVTIEHPGGIEVEKAFADTVHVFFTSYLTKEVLSSLAKQFQSVHEFHQMFAQGGRFGRSAGITAANKFMNRGLNELI